MADPWRALTTILEADYDERVRAALDSLKISGS
jgi:hypothetical protein